MARALRAWAINRGGKNSVRNLRYGPRTQLVRGMKRPKFPQYYCTIHIWVNGEKQNGYPFRTDYRQVNIIDKRDDY